MPTTINRATFEKMVAEDIAWLESVPGDSGPSSEKGHILTILKMLPEIWYKSKDSFQRIIQAWEDGCLDAGESAGEMHSIAQEALKRYE